MLLNGFKSIAAKPAITHLKAINGLPRQSKTVRRLIRSSGAIFGLGRSIGSKIKPRRWKSAGSSKSSQTSQRPIRTAPPFGCRHDTAQNRARCASQHPERRFQSWGATNNPRAEIRPLDGPEAVNRNESSDGYSNVVVVLNDKWRVIRCRDGSQWILQSRDSLKAIGDVWRARSYCRTKEALLRVCAAHAGPVDPTAASVLAALPDWIEAPNLPAQSLTTRGTARDLA